MNTGGYTDIRLQRRLSSQVQRVLSSISANQYVIAARKSGRAGVSSENRKSCSVLVETLQILTSSGSKMSRYQSETVSLAIDFLTAERDLFYDPVPRYNVYTNLSIIDRYLGVSIRLPLTETWDRCRTALAFLVNDWFQYEQHSVIDKSAKRPVGVGFKRDNVLPRIEELNNLVPLTYTETLVHIPEIEKLPQHDHEVDWGYYAMEGKGAIALCHLSALPQTRYHDEYMFLRTIHLTEVCFWGIIRSLRGALFSFHNNQVKISTRCLREANYYAYFLVRLFKGSFKTLPVESFYHGFREATGNASAIQSEKYQHLEILTRGINRRKSASLNIQPEHYWLKGWNPPESWTLSGLVNRVKSANDVSLLELRSEAYKLEMHLQTWRNIHLGIAMQYLNPGDTGTGNEGIDYLKDNYRDPIIFGKGYAPIGPDDLREYTDWLVIMPTAKSAMKGCSIGFLRAQELRLELLKSWLRSNRKLIKQKIVSTDATRDTTMQKYSSFFNRKGFIFPLPGQLITAQTKGLRRKDPIVELMHLVELSNGLLIGVHDFTRIAPPICLETANEGDEYESIKGKKIKCKQDEWVMRDRRGIFASNFQGSDFRTRLTMTSEETPIYDDLLWVIMGIPGIRESRFNRAIEMLELALLEISKNVDTIKVSL